GVDQDALRAIWPWDAEFERGIACTALEIKEASLRQVHAPCIRPLVAQGSDLLKELAPDLDAVENTARIVVLPLHPCVELRVRRILHPSIRILDRCAEVVIGDGPDRCPGWACGGGGGCVHALSGLARCHREQTH